MRVFRPPRHYTFASRVRSSGHSEGTSPERKRGTAPNSVHDLHATLRTQRATCGHLPRRCLGIRPLIASPPPHHPTIQSFSTNLKNSVRRLPPPGTDSGMVSADELREAKALYDGGILDQEDFQKIKAAFVARLTQFSPDCMIVESKCTDKRKGSPHDVNGDTKRETKHATPAGGAGGGGWGGAAPPDQRGSENGQTPRPSGQPPADKGPANPAAARNEDQQPPNAGGAPGGGRGSEGKEKDPARYPHVGGYNKNLGRGLGGKGLGKGGAKRHRKVLRDSIQGVTKPAIRRLARRGGCKRISGLVYEETRSVLKVFLGNILRDAATLTEHARRKTVSAKDVVDAFKRQTGGRLYGFD